MKLKFTKMHGCGNDYVYFNCFEQVVERPEELSKKLSHRRFGIGGDGIVLICPSEVSDAKMRMFNLDGIESKMCGNGIRCVGKYLYDNGLARKNEISIETLSGVKTLKVLEKDGKASLLTVKMGKAEFSPSKVPVNIEAEKVVAHEATFAGKPYKITCVSMGNPHCVVFCEGINSLDLEKIGPTLKIASCFLRR